MGGTLFDALDVPAEVAAAHELVFTTCAPRLGWWSECLCGWISPGYFTEARAEAAHATHQRRFIGTCTACHHREDPSGLCSACAEGGG